MIVIVNGEKREIKVSSISTLLEVVTQIEVELAQGHLITEIMLNDKFLDTNWYHNAGKIYLLDEDVINIRVEQSTVVAHQVLHDSKAKFQLLLKDFEIISQSFRIQDEVEANAKFVQGIENLQWFLKVLQDACILMGRPLDKIMDKDVVFTQHTNNIVDKLDQIIVAQSSKDWVMLADLIEYEMIPALEKIGDLYKILEV